MADDRAQQHVVVFCQPIYHMITANVYWASDVAEITAWGHAPRRERET